ncbi:MAG: hypothetical protein AAGA85_06880 [Bacteroidota bacterium]
MKYLFAILIAMPLLSAASPVVADTVVIELEGGSKIVIYTNSKSELKDLESYDFNKMIQDLNLSLDSTSTTYVEIADEDGERYKRQPQVVYYSERDDNDPDNSDRSSWKDDDDDDGDEWERYERKKERRGYNRTRNVWNVEIGTMNWLEDGEFPSSNNELYTIRPWLTWYLGLNSNFITPVAGPLHLQWGFGISHADIKFQNSRTRMVEGPEMVEFFEDLGDFSPVKSRLKVTHLNFNFVPVLDFSGRGSRGGFMTFGRYNKGIRIGAGGYVGYRIGGRTKYVVKMDGDKQRTRDKDNFYLKNLRYGARFQFGYSGFDVFVNYDLSTVFADNRGPELNNLSFGIVF